MGGGKGYLVLVVVLVVFVVLREEIFIEEEECEKKNVVCRVRVKEGVEFIIFSIIEFGIVQNGQIKKKFYGGM